ncbi:hypothetical protein C359_01842 [Cryptococcus neoformans Bt120]|nr:hypothetical protein C360_03101 [Cryptococcus neoformans var. grubii Bt15]OXG43016.1 hypothetical protein C359_01842 [Cryptococcus neoformans var. grubii Bt120]
MPPKRTAETRDSATKRARTAQSGKDENVDPPATVAEDIRPIDPKLKGRTKGRKGKSKAEATSDSPPPGPKKRVRKPFAAKEAAWRDIPDWGDRTDVPLFRLPAEVLDLCFGTKLNLGLQLRDYVALAGVSRYFRFHFTDDVFREIYLKSHPNYMKLRPCCRSPIKHSQLIFTRAVKDWRQDPPLKRFDLLEVHMHSIPRREEWTQKDYEFVTRADKIIAQARQIWADARAERANRKKEKMKKRRVMRKVIVDGISRTVLATVPGLKHGETQGPKNELGVPIMTDESGKEIGLSASHAEEENDDDDEESDDELNFYSTLQEWEWEESVHNKSGELWQKIFKLEDKMRLLRRVYDNYDKGEDFSDLSSEDEADEDKEGDKSTRKKGKKKQAAKKFVRDPNWVLPPEKEPKRPHATLVEYDPLTGERLPHDAYPSPWRARAVEAANKKFINRADAIRVFKIGEAELLCLKHYLVPNPLNPKTPSSIFSLAAIQALALRSHGGPIGHHYHVESANERALKSLATRQANVAKRKADPTYVEKEPKSRQYPQTTIDPDDIGAKYGVDKDCGIWHYQGTFIDFVADWREDRAAKAAREAQRVANGEGPETSD